MGSKVAYLVLSGWASVRVCFGEMSFWSILLSDLGIKLVSLTTCGEVGYKALTEWTTSEKSVKNEITDRQVEFQTDHE